jgi:N4-gp56 family major capsid protein
MLGLGFLLFNLLFIRSMNTISNIAYPINNYYDKQLLVRAVPSLLHDLWGQVRDIPSNMTNVIKFRRYNSLSVATTPLTEGTTPSGSDLSVTDITAVVKQYGDFITVTDILTLTGLDPILMEAAQVLGEQAGQTLDVITREVLVAGTNVHYSDATIPQVNAARSSVTSSDVIAALDIDTAVLTLKSANAMKIKNMVKPDAGYETRPVNACYVGLVHPKIAYTVKGFTGFIPVEKYASKADLMPAEIGSYGEVRFVETTQAKVFEGEGASSIDVYATLIFGANAYGVTKINGLSLENIVKPLGSAGTADPLNQRATSGWKATKTAAILNELFMIRIESASEV